MTENSALNVRLSIILLLFPMTYHLYTYIDAMHMSRYCPLHFLDSLYFYPGSPNFAN